ncbi:hypothetical protein DL546_008616 [Coniochaeta pulveracea]|uniref:PQ loop repeat protein n=1 Tax=Coniochaeta pulveracea TaxID=177199 RepID=A0A420YDR1_9PEZI|nr:hypothetical protein DL546_008616 [Coniochaeta pulveracea]
MQLVLLKVALDHRPAPSSKGGDAATPFSRAADGIFERPRPYSFWQWRSPKPYWQFLLYLFIFLTIGELVLAPMRTLYPTYSSFIGYLGLAIEAILPLPQIFANARSQSCKGFRLSVLGSWLVGDSMKMFWFFTSPTQIPWAFKLCGIFQACCDAFLGVQYWMYGSGETVLKDHHLAPWSAGMEKPANGTWRPVGQRRPSGLAEKEI